jgi:ketosteroid isomerase-like protein
MKPLAAFVLILLLSSLGHSADAAKEIRYTLDQQVQAWNRGDLPGYMRGYWNSPDLTFFSVRTATSGWQPTLERYQKRYQGEGRAMGKLDFSDLKIEKLGEQAAFVRGRWHLKMADGKEPKGLFTLIMRYTPHGWKIIHDHTSAE